jgi:hypothetical protein
LPIGVPMKEIHLQSIKNIFPDNKRDVDWEILRHDIRKTLSEKMGLISAQFSTICKYRLRSDGKTDRQPSMYNGSGGVAFALFKYVRMLRGEILKNQKISKDKKEE